MFSAASEPSGLREIEVTVCLANAPLWNCATMIINVSIGTANALAQIPRQDICCANAGQKIDFYSFVFCFPSLFFNCLTGGHLRKSWYYLRPDRTVIILRPSDGKRRQETCSSLAQLMACSLTAPGQVRIYNATTHDLGQHWHSWWPVHLQGQTISCVPHGQSLC